MNRKQYGKLRNLVSVLQAVDSMTAKGDDEIAYDEDNAELAYVNIEPLAGRELLFARQVRADLTHKVTGYYRSTYTHRTQMRWNDGFSIRKFNLGPALDTDNRHVQHSWYAVEIK